MITPELVAHRGYTLHYPENTLPAVEAAIAAGARYVEIDIQLSSDGVPVLFHDRDLNRLCGGRGSIHEFSIDELREFRVSESGRFGYKFAQVPIATLAQLVALISRHPDVTVFVEIKRIAIERFGIATVLRRVTELLRPVAGRCVLISYDLDFLLEARQHGSHQLGAIVEPWGARQDPRVQRLHPEYLFTDVDGLPHWGKLHMEGTKLAVYEVTDPELALRLAKRGIALVETFAIGEMLKALALRRGGAA